MPSLLATLIVSLVVRSATPAALPLATGSLSPPARWHLSLRSRAGATAQSVRMSALRGGGEARAVQGRHELGSHGPIQTPDPTLEQAREIWIQAVDASPQDASLLFEYALFLQEDANDYLASEAMYKKVLRLEPSNAAALTNYATILSEHRGDLTGAESAFQLAVLINPNDGTALANYAALVLEKRHEPRRAQDLYLYSLQADPSNIATLYNYAVMLEEHVNDFSGASRLLQVALHIDPASRECRERLAAIERQRARRAGQKAAQQLRESGDGDGGVAESRRMQCVREFSAAGVERERQLFRAAVALDPSVTALPAPSRHAQQGGKGRREDGAGVLYEGRG
jgi:tetratricopeptide (TPR) repeat protein